MNNGIGRVNVRECRQQWSLKPKMGWRKLRSAAYWQGPLKQIGV
jgi:hypothetical protein